MVNSAVVLLISLATWHVTAAELDISPTACVVTTEDACQLNTSISWQDSRYLCAHPQTVDATPIVCGQTVERFQLSLTLSAPVKILLVNAATASIEDSKTLLPIKEVQKTNRRRKYSWSVF